MRRLVASLSLVTLCLIFGSSSASAAPAGIEIVQQAGVDIRGDFQVGPTKFVLEMDPGEERTVEVQLTSREGEERTYALDVEDFSVSNDGLDNMMFYGNGTGPFSAKSWIDTTVPVVTLKHGERAFISVKVTIPKNASVGDHYSVVMFRRLPKGGAPGGLGIVSRVGALLLITVKGDVIRDGGLQQFLSVRRVYWALPAQFVIQYRNSGTVHIVPFGKIEIRNVFGIAVDEIQVKDWYVLRNSIRRREIIWQPKFALGYYTANLRLKGVGSGAPDVYQSVSFWVVPALPVLLALLAIFSVSFIVQAFFGHFEIRRKKE